MYCFYASDDTIITKQDFIEIYNNGYYLGNTRQVPRVTQNSKIAENEIERILREGIKEPIDVYRIMAWKVGKIRHADSDAASEIRYASNWKNAETGIVRNYRYRLNMTDFAQYIVSNIGYLEELALTDPQRVLNNLVNAPAPKGIGTVYLITLLYFISRGKWPIYDRFAMMALTAITEGKKPGEAVCYLELPDKNSENFNSVMDICKQTYIKQLEDIFGKDYNKTRNVDRALWVYGHRFKKA